MIVGQAPGPRTDPRRPLDGPSGRRLERLAGLPPGALPARAEVVNLLRRWPGRSSGNGDAFPAAEAGAAARRLLRRLRGRTVVLLGLGVARAFSARAEWFAWQRLPGGVLAAVAPHPSGVNHWWNDAGNVRRAARFFKRLLRPARAGR